MAWLIIWSCFLFSFSTATSSISSIPLNEWPMVMSHDAATGYLHQTLVNEEVYRWTITQNRNASGQLDCGSRSFDWRPALNKKDELVMHHGSVLVNYPMASAVAEMIAWCNEHPNDEDLVVMHLTDCQGGQSCKTKSLQLFQQLGVEGVIQNCGQLKGMTVGDALQISGLANGGHLLVLFNCGVYENWWPPNGCSGFRNVTENEKEAVEEYVCYNDSDTKWYPLGRMFGYVQKTGARAPPGNGYLTQNQALWQETAYTVSIGDTYRSSLIKDEAWSNLNAYVVANVDAGNFKYINFLEVNNVCNQGPELLAALRKWVGLEVVEEKEEQE